MPWGEYNCGSRPLKTTRSKPDSTPKTTAAKRCTKVFIGVLRVQKDRVVTIFLFSGHRLSILPAAQPRCVSVVHPFRNPLLATPSLLLYSPACHWDPGRRTWPRRD